MENNSKNDGVFVSESAAARIDQHLHITHAPQIKFYLIILCVQHIKRNPKLQPKIKKYK